MSEGALRRDPSTGGVFREPLSGGVFRATATSGEGCCCCPCAGGTCATGCAGDVANEFSGTVTGVDYTTWGSSVCITCSGKSFKVGAPDPNTTYDELAGASCQWDVGVYPSLPGNIQLFPSDTTCSGFPTLMGPTGKARLTKSVNQWRFQVWTEATSGGTTVKAMLFDGTITVTDPVDCCATLDFPTNSITGGSCSFDGVSTYTLGIGTGGSAQLVPCP